MDVPLKPQPIHTIQYASKQAYLSVNLFHPPLSKSYRSERRTQPGSGHLQTATPGHDPGNKNGSSNMTAFLTVSPSLKTVVTTRTGGCQTYQQCALYEA